MKIRIIADDVYLFNAEGERRIKIERYSSSIDSEGNRCSQVDTVSLHQDKRAGVGLKWTHCPGQNTGKISKMIESHRHYFSRDTPQPASHNRDSGEVTSHYRNAYNELIHQKGLVPSGTVSGKHLHT